jgi:alpha-amylase
MKKFFTSLILLTATLAMMAQGWPNDYKGVMLQGFYWDSFDDTQWATLEKQANDLASSFNLIWIPQSGNCGSTSMGYDDLWWFSDYNSSFGSEEQLRSMIKTFKDRGLGTIADVVINHRKNLSNWVDFPKETYKGVTYEMVSTDIVANDDGGETKKWATDHNYSLSTHNDSGEGWSGMRDLDHYSENVQTIVKAYLHMLLEDFGYVGFRYDMVKGYASKFTKLYNEDVKPQFSVGEYFDGSRAIGNWIDNSDKSSAAFDFDFKYVMRNATDKGDWTYLGKNNGSDNNWPLVSNEFRDGSYRQYAVTFVENHDTEVRSDGSENGPLKRDTLAANAYLLAMPGTPCIFLKHWQAYKPEIKAMIEARKAAGIRNTSTYTNIENNKKYYANTVDDKLLVVVGDEKQVNPDANKWTKVLSGHHYAYYLANELETAWANRGSGDFYEPFDVTLTAVSNTPGVKLEYSVSSPEPSTRTMYSGGEVESGTTIKIDAKESVVLDVYLVIDGVISGGISRVFTYREPELEPEIVIPDFCTYAENEVCAFFEAPASWTKTIYCWAWTSNPAENFTSKSGTWPGVACEELGTAPNGNKVWKWKWDGTKQNNTSLTKPEMIIFSSEGAPQTADLVFENGGYYVKDGLFGVVESTTAIHGIETAHNGLVKVYSLDGRLLRTAKDSREATIGLPKGIYIVNNKKLVLK